MRIDSEKYLRSHPEVQAMLTEFTARVVKEEPDDVLAFAAAFFTSDELRAVCEARLKSA